MIGEEADMMMADQVVKTIVLIVMMAMEEAELFRIVIIAGLLLTTGSLMKTAEVLL
jgi:hypothetical protein